MPRRYLVSLAVLIAVLACPQLAPAETEVGEIITTTTWTAAGSPYHVAVQCTVAMGNTLTIEPGVDVLFDVDVQFVVEGSMYALGTETDSIRFLKGTAAEWGGIRLMSADSAYLAYVRISGGHAHTAGAGNNGGAIYATGSRVGLSHCVLSGNSAGYNGGAIAVENTVSLNLSHCIIRNNTTGHDGGGIYYTTVTAPLMIDRSVIYGNTASNAGGAILIWSGSLTTVTNSVVWANNSALASWGTYTVTYSDIQGGFAGTGNIAVDPHFTDPSQGDYTLSEGSPCINTGDWASPLDPDGSVADMGALPFDLTGTNYLTGRVLTQTLDAGIHRVKNTVTVPPGNTLTIEPGVDVLFDADVQFIVQGVLHAVGTPQDSIRFLKGEASEWGGVRILGGGPQSFAYLRISDAHGDGVYPSYDGGAMFVDAPGVVVDLANVLMIGNRADHDAGGLMIYTGTVTMSDCAVRDNTAMFGAGLCLYGASAVVSLSHTVIADNTASGLSGQEGGGGGVFLNVQSSGTFTNCTIAGNTATIGAGSGIFVTNSATAHFHNSVVWGNSPGGTDAVTSGASLYAEYSDLPGSYPGTGNIGADPLFTNPSQGDYTLSAGSPCIDAGDPASPLDPDGTPADMGATPYQHPWTNVGGTITTTTWSAEGSPYRVTGTITVPTGNTLTIEPGVDVLFDADAQFVVNGVLHAVGTPQDSIRFLASAENDSGEWGGIRIFGGDTSTIGYARISDGSAEGSVPDGHGGGIYLQGTGTRLGLVHTVISGNTAARSGGGVTTTSGTVATLANCTISGNSASEGGGAINFSGTVTMTNCTVSGNWANYGAGVVSTDGTVTMTNCTISDNSATLDGGGVRSQYTALTMTDCTISGNTAGTNSGGLHVGPSTQTVTIANCVISDNSAAVAGGGVSSYTTQGLVMTNCTISGNSGALVGGGVYNYYDSWLTITNCTISGNSASQAGGGLYDRASAVATLRSCIVWTNTAPDGPQIYPESGGTTLRYSDIQGGIPSGVTDGGGNIDADPLFVDAANGDYDLQPGSPCIDAGDPASASDPDGTRADIGAYYFHQNTVFGTITTTTWTKPNSPYRIVGAITIPIGNVLTIEAGVDVLFDADVQFVVEGTLYAVGTETDSIRFIKGSASEWGGIRISGGDSSTIAYAKISGGHAEGSDPDRRGGGVYVAGPGTRVGVANSVISGNTAYAGAGLYANSSVVTLANCIIAGNSAQWDAGGLQAVASSVSLSGCTVSANTSQYDGGGIHVGGTTLTAENCTIAGNSAVYRDGGGFYVDDQSTIVLDNCDISGNTVVWSGGGGLFLEGGSAATLNNCTVSDNSVRYSGGGLELWEGSSATLNGCSLTGNGAVEAGGGGGALYANNSPVTMSNCDITNNTSLSYGGAFCFENAGCVIVINGCTIVGNSGGEDGGALVAWDAVDLTLSNCTVSGNAALRGGALNVWISTVTVTNTILWANTPEEFYIYDGQPLTITAAYSDIAGDTTWVGPGNINADPLFVDPANDDYHLQPGSPCIHAGDPASPLDQDGTRADMGAYPFTCPYGDASENGFLAALDASLILQSLVGKHGPVNPYLCDVTARQDVTALDAAYVLKKVLDPEFVFPVEEQPGKGKTARSAVRLSWACDENGWALRVEKGSGILSMEATFVVAAGVLATAPEASLLEQHGTDTGLRVALVRNGADDPVLLRLRGEAAFTEPTVVSLTIDEEAVSPSSIARPLVFALEQNVPNPFNPTTTLRFSVPEASRVNLTVFSITGQIVRTLVDGTVEAGSFDVVWDGRDAGGREVSSGVYLYRVEAGGNVSVRKMVLVR